MLLSGRARFKLFVASFLALYFELLVIRYLSTEFILFGILKNLPLIASFFGLGVGMLGLCNLRFARRSFVFLAVPLFLLARFGQHLPLPSLGWDFAVWQGGYTRAISVLLFLAFTTGVLWLIVGFFVVLGGFVGELLDQFSPLMGYGINLLGSLAGAVAFTSLSFLRTPPVIWLGVGFSLLLPWIWRRWTDAAALAALLAITAIPQPNTFCSPYHRIDVKAILMPGSPTPSAYNLSYNHAWYQSIVDLSEDFLQRTPKAEPNSSLRDYYELPYRFVSNPQDVLIVGAGTGNDVAAALRHGAERVDAVEIDPVILAMGRRYHPERPYSSSRVTTYVDDARIFLSHTKRRYDVIVFGFLDSSTLLTSFSSLRLDNYVYTRESFEAARERLKPSGTLFLAFAVTRGFVANRLFATLSSAFGVAPRAFVTRTNVSGMLFVEGAARSSEVAGVQEVTSDLRNSSRGAILATDSWPFLYLEHRSIPLPLCMVIFTFAATAWIWQRNRLRPGMSVGMGEFFFLGAGFLLLETKAITQLSLLYGSTWLVNGAVINAFLVMALAANILAARFKINSHLCYVALLILLAISSVVPYSLLAGSPLVTRIGASAFWTAIPVLLSGAIFSTRMRGVTSTATALGINLLGAIVGGLLENAVLLGGIPAISWIACLVYVAAWACQWGGRPGIVEAKKSANLAVAADAK